MLGDITFRLTDNLDPEERLEEAATWKAIYDATEGQATAVTGDTPAIFGRVFKNEYAPHIAYWEDPVFLAETRRSFVTLELNQAFLEIDRLHQLGKGAFVKSTRDKHAIFECPVGTNLREIMGDMIWSFIDGGPLLMVQELVEITYEYRFFCVNRKIVTDSPHHPKLTPLDHPVQVVYKTTRDEEWFMPSYSVRRSFLPVAERIGQSMQYRTAVIDCGYINGLPGCVEINPFRLGQVGLFGCNVRALVSASIQEHLRLSRI